MKRISLIVSCLLLATSFIFSQNTVASLQKKWVIEDINSGNYERAVSNFKMMDWRFEYDENDYNLNLAKYDEFAPYALNAGITQLQAVSLYQYLADALNDMANYYKEEQDYNNFNDALTAALNYYSTAADMYDEITTRDINYNQHLQLFLFNYESALFRHALSYTRANDFQTSEKIMLETIELEKQRQALPNVDKYDLGVNLDEVLIQIRAWSMDAKDVATASIINDAERVIKEERTDTTAIWVLLEAADYSVNHSDFRQKDYYLRTAYNWVKQNVALRKQMQNSAPLYLRLLNDVTSHYYAQVATEPIISENEVNEAAQYIAKKYGEMSIQSMLYTLNKVLYYSYQNKQDKAIEVNESFIERLDKHFNKSLNTNDEMKSLYVFAHLTLSGLYEKKYNMDTTAYQSIFDNTPKQIKPEEYYAYNTLKKIFDNPQFNQHLNIEFYNSFLDLCYSLNHNDEIWQYAPTYYQLNHNNINNALTTLSEDDAIQWWSHRPFFYDNTILFATKDSNVPDYIAGEIYNNELFKKDILLRTNKRLQQYIASSNDTTVNHLYQRLIEQKTQLLEWQSSKHYEDQQMQDLAESINSTERLLASISNTYANQLQESNITWKDIQAKLKVNEVAIEFLNAGALDQYWVLLIRKEYKQPKLIYLPDFIRLYPEDVKFQMDMWHKYGEDVGMDPPEFLKFAGDAGEVYQYGDNGSKLYEALWQPLTSYIHEGETVYFAPSGILLQLSVEALPIDAKTILSDKYNLVRLSSTRELARQKHPATNKQAVLYGNIKYTVQQDEMELLVQQSEKYRGLYQQVNGSSADGISRGRINPLPGTAKEVQTITKQLSAAHYKTQLYEAIAANEESLKALSGKSPQILHIATHAFYWDNDRASTEPFVERSTPQGVTMINPMSRCGILFAGASIAYNGNNVPQGVEDGILTAEEISLLDLQQTKILVLSACETGLGELTDAGVFGLQRAFKQAGVETIIMSLWKVDDNATQELMTKFYQYWLSGKTTREAFYQAQSDLRRTHPEPHFWAGFIMLD